MAGNITIHDIDIMLEQMETMKTKVLLLQDYNNTFNPYFAALKIPVLKYSTKHNSNEVSLITFMHVSKIRNYKKIPCKQMTYLCSERLSKVAIPIKRVVTFNPWQVCQVHLRNQRYIPIFIGYVRSIKIY